MLRWLKTRHLSKNVRVNGAERLFRKWFEFRHRPGGQLARSRRLSPDSGKTYENPARGTAWRYTCEFLGRAEASFIGRACFNGAAR
jgi:hypothetical protein